MKRRTTYFSITIILIVVASCKRNNTIPSLEETFFAKDKNPFGAYIAHHQLEQLYKHNTIKDIKQHFTKTWNEISDTGSLYINISRNFILSKADRNAMLNYVYAGNSMFVSSEYIDDDLLAFFHCAQWGKSGPAGLISDLDYTSVKMDSAIYNDPANYFYYYLPFSNYFHYDSGYATVLGRNENGLPDFIVIFYGKGRFYLHCEPRAFSNYFLLQKNNYHYLQNAFAFTPEIPAHVFWDDYYNKHNTRNSDSDGESMLSFLLQYPSLAWAFGLSLLLLLLFILFDGKRKQRIIKVVPPNTNTTLAFTETIGRLYYQENNNKDMADKMIAYLLERIRNQYFLNTSQLNDAFIASLSRKSSVSKDVVEVLFATIASIQQSEEISNKQLLLLNRQIENFYKNNV